MVTYLLCSLNNIQSIQLHIKEQHILFLGFWDVILTEAECSSVIPWLQNQFLCNLYIENTDETQLTVQKPPI